MKRKNKGRIRDNKKTWVRGRLAWGVCPRDIFGKALFICRGKIMVGRISKHGRNRVAFKPWDIDNPLGLGAETLLLAYHLVKNFNSEYKKAVEKSQQKKTTSKECE